MQLLGRLILLGGLVAALSSVAADAPRDPGSAGPFTTGAYSVTVTVPGAEALLPIEIHYPRSGDGVDPSASPYPGIVFAHGFMGSASTYPGNGQHLASWGYIVAMPDFTDEAIEVRTTEARHALTVLEAENARSASLLYQQVDTTRLGITGHSLGGCTTMMVSARDGRIKAAVALDPVNPEEFIGDGPWDHEAEAPNIWAPMAIIGAPSQMCNSNANYEGLYPHMGSRHKTKLVIADSSHCDYMVTDAALERWACYLLCGGEYDEGRVSLIQRYSTAWLNYYLKGDLAYYHYVYGVGFAQPESEGAYTSTLDTSPRNLRAIGDATGARLDWEVCDYAIVAGYNVYRWPQGQPCPASPVAQIGRVGDYHDTGATHGVLYH